MAPPRRISSSARSLFGEPEPPVYFPPVGQGNGAFGSYVSPQYAATSRIQDDELDNARDDSLTRKADNLLQRASAASEYTLLPYSTAAKRARLDFEPEQIDSQRRLMPSMEARRIADDQYNTELDKAQLEDLPDMVDDRRAERDARVEAIQNRDPYVERLQRDHAANKEQAMATFQQFQGIAPKELRGAKRSEWAEQQTRGILKQREAVDAANFLSNELDATTGKPLSPEAMGLIETVVDSEGLPIGHRIKKGSDPQKVSEMILSYRRHQGDKAVREKRLKEDSSYYNQDIDNTSQLLKLDEGKAESYIKTGRPVPEDLNEGIKGHRMRLQQLNEELRKLRGLPPIGAKQATPLPATTEPAKEEKESSTVPKGADASIADFYKRSK